MAVANIGMSFVQAGMVYGTPGISNMFASNTAASTVSSTSSALPLDGSVSGYNYAIG